MESGFFRFASSVDSHSPLVTIGPTSAWGFFVSMPRRMASISVTASGKPSISSSSARSRAWFTSTHLPFRNASPSVCPSSCRMSSWDRGTPSAVSSGCTDTRVSNPSMDGCFSPSRMDRDTTAVRFFHQLGMRHKMPVSSMASTWVRKSYASSAVNWRGWNISPLSTKDPISSDTSAARLRQERRVSSSVL